MMQMSRRDFLRRSAVAAGAVTAARFAAVSAAATAGTVAGARAAGAAEFFAAPLRIPPVLTEPDITLVAQQADVAILPGAPTSMWTFGGTFPGPTIRRPSGEPTRVTIQHDLPAEVGSLTVHHHGAHSASSEDGQPGREVIEPGAARTYTYEFMEDGAPERAAFQWYHDHSHYRTNLNMWRGLAGMFILDDEFEAALPLPAGDFDVPLLLAERQFDADNQLTQPFTLYDDDVAIPPGAGAGYPPNDDIIGDTLLVNGVPHPYFEVAARRYRFRILNASPFRPYNLTLSNGADMVQIGTESGLLPAPLRRSEILIGPAERVDVVIDFSGGLGASIVLESVPADGSLPLRRTGPPLLPVMEFRVTSEAVDDSSVPEVLRPLPDWTDGLDATPDRVWAFGLGVNPQARTAWTINGQAFDHERVDARPALNSVETWMLVNTTPTATSHYIHIHDVDWKVLSRNGEAPEEGEDALKETFRLDPGEVIVVAAKFSDHLGPYMLHCHMLEHEDHGMMTTFEVVEPQNSDNAGKGLDTALECSISDPAERARVRAVIAAAQGGSPAPDALLAGSAGGAVAAEQGGASPYRCELT